MFLIAINEYMYINYALLVVSDVVLYARYADWFFILFY